MTTTSAQSTYSTVLTTEQLDALSTIDTITLTTSSIGSSTYTYTPCYTTATSTVTLGTGTSSFCIPQINISSIESLWGGAEWVNSFPAWGRIQEMCEQYPGLKLAFEKFKNTYNLVKDDFDSPPEKRIKP